jgi:hypothetical protein
MNRIAEDATFNTYGVEITSFGKVDHEAIEAALNAANLDYLHEDDNTQYHIELGKQWYAVEIMNELGYETDEDD